MKLRKKSRKWSSLNKRKIYPKSKKINTQDELKDKINISSQEKIIISESIYADEEEDYFNQFKNYKIRHEFDQLGMLKTFMLAFIFLIYH